MTITIMILIALLFAIVLTSLFYRKKIISWFKAHKKLGVALITIMVAAPTGALLYLGDQPIEPPLPEPPIIQPYYFQFDSNIPGAFGKYVLNPEYTRQWLKDNFFWRLQASGDNSTWNDANQLLKIDIKYDDVNLTAKLTLTLNTTNAPKSLYYRFDLACNASMKEYLDESTLSQWNFKVPVGDRDMNVYFNWSDIKPLVQQGKVWFKHGIKTVEGQDYFWFRIQSKNKIPVGTVFVIDPTYGLIGDAVTNTWEYNKLNGQQPSMIRLGTSEYYAIVSNGNGNNGFINVTQVWNGNGTIKTNCIDSWEYDTTDGLFPRILYWGGNTYIIAYKDTTGTKDTIFTVDISSTTGLITKVAGDTLLLTYMSPAASCIDMVRVTGNLFAVVQTDTTSSDLFLYTFFVNASNDISGIIDTQEIDTIDGIYPRMCMVDSDTIAVVYDGGTAKGNDGFMVTYNISTAGAITNTNSSWWEFEQFKANTPVIAKVTGNIFMIAFANANSDLFVNTTTIANTGTITKAWLDGQVFDATLGLYPTFFNVSYNSIPNKWIKGISFVGTGSDVWISTFDVNSTGYITSEIDTLTFGADTVAWYIPTCFVSGFYFLSIHEDASLDGWAKTFQIYVNLPPTIANPSPANGAVDVATTPQLSVNVSDIGDYLNATWSSNSSGSWVDFGTNSSIPSYGAISDSVVSSYEFNGVNGAYTSAVKLGNDGTFTYFAIVYAGSGSDGFINTTKVWNNNGTIYPTIIDSYEYDTTDGRDPSIIYISGNVYAIFYRDTSKMTVVTVSISSIGDIDTATGCIDTLILTAGVGYSSEIIKVIGHIYVVAYQDTAYDYYIQTIWINDSGTINDTVLDTQFVLATASATSTDVNTIMLDNNTILVCTAPYIGNNYYNLSTWNISSSGIITNTYADSWVPFGTSIYETYIWVCHVSGNIYAAYYAVSGTGYGTIGTFLVDTNGMFTKTWINTLVVSNIFHDLSIISLGNNLFAASSKDLYVVKINDDGIIACFQYDSLSYSSTVSYTTKSIIPILNDYYFIVYTGVDIDGWSCTVKIENETTQTLKQTNSNFSAASTKYYWRVNVSDDVNQNYSIYSFTTAGAGGNTPPIFSEEDPVNNSIGIAIDIGQLTILINDTEGDTFGYEWGCSDGSSNSAAGNTNGSKILMLNMGDLDYSTLYTWWINATDEHGLWTNETYTFTTETLPGVKVWYETIRNNGVDYFVWLGSNCTAYNVTLQLTGFDEIAEYVAIWKNDTWNDSYGAWQRYFGDKTGINFTIHTFDVVEVYLTDVGTQTFDMIENLTSGNYTNSKTYTLRNSTKNYGWNYSAFNRQNTSMTTLSAINTSIDLPENYFVALWNETNYAWDYWVSGFWEIDKNVWMWDVIMTKVDSSRTWVT